MANLFPEVDWSAIEDRYLKRLRERDPEEFRKMYLGEWTSTDYPTEKSMTTVKALNKNREYPMTLIDDMHQHRESADLWMRPEHRMKLATNENSVRMGNPCSEVSAGSYSTVEGHKIYSGPLTRFRYDEDDGDMYLSQTACLANPEVYFGPLSTKISALLGERSHRLECRITRYARKETYQKGIRIYLTDGVSRYKTATVTWSALQMLAKHLGEYDLAECIKSGVNLVRASSSMPVVVEKLVIDERDPFEVIAARYPKPTRVVNPNVPLPGTNRTLREEVRYQLTGKTPDQL